MKRRNLTTPIVYLIMLGIIVLLVSGFDLSGDKVKKISYSEFIDDVRNGRIQAAEVTELKLVGLYSDSKISMEVFPQEADFYTYIPSVDILKDDMDKVTAELTGREANDITQADYPFSLVLNPAPGPSILETLLPYILLFGGLALFYVLMTRAQGGGNNIMNFGKSRAVQTWTAGIRSPLRTLQRRGGKRGAQRSGRVHALPQAVHRHGRTHTQGLSACRPSGYR